MKFRIIKMKKAAYHKEIEIISAGKFSAFFLVLIGNQCFLYFLV